MSSSASSRPTGRPKRKPEIVVVDETQLKAAADAAPPIDFLRPVDTSDIADTDFSEPHAVRGKYADKSAADCNARLDPDVREAFPDDLAVNRALRGLIGLASTLDLPRARMRMT